MRVGSSFFGGAIFGGAFFGSPPSPSETSLVGKMCHFSSSAVWGVAEVCPLWLWPFHYPPASRLQPLYRQPRSPPCHWTKSSFLVYFPSVQISVSPGWPYFQTHSKLALQPALVCLIWIPGLSSLFIPLPIFHLWSTSCWFDAKPPRLGGCRKALPALGADRCGYCFSSAILQTDLWL